MQFLKVEWLKVKNYRTFWILSGLFVISLFGINYIVYTIREEITRKSAEATIVMGSSPFMFPEVWNTVSYFSSFLLFIPGLLMIISITNEFSFKTHRQNIIDGWSRTQFIFVKMTLAIIIAAASALIVFTTALLFGISVSGISAISFYNIETIGYFFIQALSYAAVALLFGILFRRSGISIGVFFLYVVVLENMVAGLLNHYFGGAGNYLPLEITDNLIPFPLFKQVVNQIVTRPNIIYLLVGAFIYLILYFIICKRKFETSDL